MSKNRPEVGSCRLLSGLLQHFDATWSRGMLQPSIWDSAPNLHWHVVRNPCLDHADFYVIDSPHCPLQSFTILYNPLQSFTILYNPLQSFTCCPNPRNSLGEQLIIDRYVRQLCPRVSFLRLNGLVQHPWLLVAARC